MAEHPGRFDLLLKRQAEYTECIRVLDAEIAQTKAAQQAYAAEFEGLPDWWTSLIEQREQLAETYRRILNDITKKLEE